MIRVIPDRMELGVMPEVWEAVVEGLNAEGLDARLERRVEYRDAYDIAEGVGLFLGGYVAEATLDVIAGVLREKLRGKRRVGPMKGQPRRVPIYGPNGDVLREVEVPSDQDDDSAA